MLGLIRKAPAFRAVKIGRDNGMERKLDAAAIKAYRVTGDDDLLAAAAPDVPGRHLTE